MNIMSLQEHPEQAKKKRLNHLKETMLKGSPFPRLRAKAAEAKSLLEPVASALHHFKDQDPSQIGAINAMVQVLTDSRNIDVLIDDMRDFKPSAPQAVKLEQLVLSMNLGFTKLCHMFRQQGLFLFNFLPKNHYLFHLVHLARFLSPRLAWCYQGENLMHKVKVLAQGSFRGTPSKTLGNKVLRKYLLVLSYALSA